MENSQNIDSKNLEQAHLDFISTVSHELRTPLTSIRGFADTLINSFDKLSPEQRERFLHIIKDQSNRLINLVENLLMVSKINSENEIFVYKSVSVKPFVTACIQLVKAQYKNKTFKTFFENNLPDILIDTDKFQQILLNLIDNAAKYSYENSEIIVKSSQNTQNNTVSIKIINNGEGINQENLTKIFEKFSRVDSPLTRKVQGSGLGLYITRNLTEKMNGNILVSSKGDEITFEVTFPIANFGEPSLKKIKE